MQEQALAAGEEDENESFGTRSFGTDTTHTIQSDPSRADFRVPVYFIENGARQGGGILDRVRQPCFECVY